MKVNALSQALSGYFLTRRRRFNFLRPLYQKLTVDSLAGEPGKDAVSLGDAELENDEAPRLVLSHREDSGLGLDDIGLVPESESSWISDLNQVTSWFESLPKIAVSDVSFAKEISAPRLPTYYIYQSDIDGGTLILDEPGRYVVMENLSFNPNKVGTQVFGLDAQMLGLEEGDRLDAYQAGRLLPSQFSTFGGDYDPKAYGIGHFAMLSFTSGASGSVLDLNGFRLEQSEEHALQQRFFAVIETAGAPFITGQGPHDFGPGGNNAVSDVVIKNGTIGRSSHHGVHGNGNNNIVIKDVVIEDFEVAAVALNGVDGLTIKDVTASSRTDVPVVGAWSNARFISAYVDYLASLELRGVAVESLIVNGESLSAQDIRFALQESINTVFDDIITEGDGVIDVRDENYYLYNNATGVADGNAYGFLTGPVGVQVNGFPDPGPNGFQTPSRNVHLKNVRVSSLAANVTEAPVLSNHPDGGSQPVTDPVGAAFMLRNKSNGIFSTLETWDRSVLLADASVADILDSNYKGNPLANAQLLVAKNRDLFEDSFLDVSRLSIGDDIVAWAESDDPLSDLRESLDLDDGWIYAADTMLHVNKGVIGFKMDGVIGATLVDVSAENITNYGEPGFDGNYSKGFVKDTLTGYNGGNSYGFTFSGSSDIYIKDAEVDQVISSYGEAFGFASPLDNTTNLFIKNADVEGLVATGMPGDGVNPPGNAYEYFNV